MMGLLGFVVSVRQKTSLRPLTRSWVADVGVFVISEVRKKLAVLVSM